MMRMNVMMRKTTRRKRSGNAYDVCGCDDGCDCGYGEIWNDDAFQLASRHCRY